MIAVLLCTYNGAQYLEQQLLSLVAQRYQDFVVYIHDDGSTDTTLEIMQRFVNNFPGKFILMEDSVKRRGAGPSFMWLLERVESDYYMFCDQDDCWLINKIGNTLNRIREVEAEYPSKPVLIHTDLKLTDGELNVTNESFWDYQNFKVDISKKKEFIGFGNIVTGCTMIINDAAKNVAFPYDGKTLHDYWLALKVAKYGVIDNLKEQTILYRQHGDNEAGAGREYKKRTIAFKRFFDELSEELARVRDVSGARLFKWFIYRIYYFFCRHF